MKHTKQFKSGATSIYVVVIATLLFSVLTVSFIRIIINESNRTTSDELAQMAYDSALAGVEDAKVALKKYYECKINENSGDCDMITQAILDSIASSNETVTDNYVPYCDGVSRALGRISDNDAKEVLIQEQSGINDDTVQAYTCVMLNDILADYRSTLSSATTIRVVPLRPESGYTANDITGIKISWFSQDNGEISSYTFNNKGEYGFKPSGEDGVSTPPTISAQIIQTTKYYQLSDFETSRNGQTDRGTIFFVPTNQDGYSQTHVTADTVAASNDHTTINNPQEIRCNSDPKFDDFEELSSEFGCVATMEIPAPIRATLENGVVKADSRNERSDETFFLVLALPYGQPTTDFAVQLCTDTGTNGDSIRGDCKDADGKDAIARFSGVQTAIDSTGRANDMYSRVEVRVEFSDTNYPFPEAALQATGDADDAIRKNFYVTENCWTRNSTGIATCNNYGESN